MKSVFTAADRQDVSQHFPVLSPVWVNGYKVENTDSSLIWFLLKLGTFSPLCSIAQYAYRVACLICGLLCLLTAGERERIWERFVFWRSSYRGGFLKKCLGRRHFSPWRFITPRSLVLIAGWLESRQNYYLTPQSVTHGPLSGNASPPPTPPNALPITPSSIYIHLPTPVIEARPQERLYLFR